jgi:hypothetical protein
MNSNLKNIISSIDFNKTLEKEESFLIKCEVQLLKNIYKQHIKDLKKYNLYRHSLITSFWKKVKNKDNYKLMFQLILNQYFSIQDSLQIINLIQKSLEIYNFSKLIYISILYKYDNIS